MYTLGSAFHSFDEDKLGSIEPGKLADLAVLSDDPLSVSDDKLKRLRSVLTLQAGRIVHGETTERDFFQRGELKWPLTSNGAVSRAAGSSRARQPPLRRAARC